MPKVRQTKEWTKADALAEIISAEPCDFVLETAPPDYVEKISQLLGSSSAGQTGQDGAAADKDSDSGDSLFITQKPVPEAVRAGRRRRHGKRSGPASPSFQEESEDDSSPSTSRQQSRSKKKKVKFRLPKYSFPFLKDKTLKLTSTVLPGPQNTRLHYSAMGGFFECMRQLQQRRETGADLESVLPAVDMNGECIVPISEGEEEPMEEADMKVVAKKRFVVPSKVKPSQPWHSETRDGEAKQQRTSCVNAVGKMSRGWRKTLDKTPPKRPSLRSALSSHLEGADDEGSSYRVLGAGGTSDKQQTGERGAPAQIETPKTNRSLNKDISERQEKEHELRDDSSAPLCEQSPKEQTQEGREASVNEPQGGGLNREGLSHAGRQECKPKGQSFFQSAANRMTKCSETNNKKNGKEDNKSAEEDDSQSLQEPEVERATPSMNEEITEVEATPHLPQTINEPELHGKPVMEDSDISDSQKKKKTLNLSPAEYAKQEQHEHFESDVKVGEDSAHLDRGEGKKKEDKEADSAKEEMSQSQEEVEAQRAAAHVNERITEEEETPHLSQTINELHGKPVMEDSDISDSRQKKKKKRQNESPAEDDRQEVCEHFESDVKVGEESAHLDRGEGKKKEDKEAEESAIEEMSQSQEEVEAQRAAAHVNERITEEEETPHLSQVTSELDLNGTTGMEESDISDSRQKKKKKKKRQNESPAEDDRQEVCEHFESDVRLGEESAHLVSFNRGKKKKKKKKKNDKDSESVEEEKSQSQEELEAQHAGAHVNERITEEEETPHLSQSTEPEFSEKHMKKKKKKKRKKESPGENEETGKEENKTESNNGDEDAERLKCVTAPECLHDGVEMLTEKISAGSPDESAELTGGLEESNERVRKKKKKKRKTTAAQESVEKDQELDFEEPKGACEEAPSDTGVRKKKHKRNEAESAAEAGCSDEAAAVKKKWKKRREEAPSAGSEEKVHSEPPSSHSVLKKKQKNVKRRLHNPSEDFLTDL